MANMSVDSAAFAKLTSALQGQSVALNKLTSELGADNKREFLQKAKPITIQSVQTRQGMRPFDTAIADAVARAQTPASKVIVEREREEGLLSKIAKGIVGIGAIAIVFKSIQNNPELKKAFNATVTTIKDFFVGPEGIITKALGFLTDGTGGEILRDIENTIMGMFPEDGFMRSLATTGVQAIKTVFSAIETLIDYIKDPGKIYEDITSLIGGVMAGGAKLLSDSLKKAGPDLGSIFGGAGGGGGILGILTGDPESLGKAEESIKMVGSYIFSLVQQVVNGGPAGPGIKQHLKEIDSAVKLKISNFPGLEDMINKIAGIKFDDIAKSFASIGKFADVKVQTALMFTLVQLNKLADKLPSIASEFSRIRAHTIRTLDNKTLGKIVDIFYDKTKSDNLENILTGVSVLIDTLGLSPAMKTMALNRLLPAAATGTATPGGAGAPNIIAPITNLDNTIKTLKTAIDNLSSKIDAMKTAAFDPDGSNGEQVAVANPESPNPGHIYRDAARALI